MGEAIANQGKTEHSQIRVGLVRKLDRANKNGTEKKWVGAG
jgi:hypothetical protein